MTRAGRSNWWHIVSGLCRLGDGLARVFSLGFWRPELAYQHALRTLEQQ